MWFKRFHVNLHLLLIFRKVLGPDGQSTRIEDKVLTINIKPGWKSGTKITFPKEGDQHPGRVPADIVFVIKDKHHPKFKVRWSAYRIGLSSCVVKHSFNRMKGRVRLSGTIGCV